MRRTCLPKLMKSIDPFSLRGREEPSVEFRRSSSCTRQQRRRIFSVQRGPQDLVSCSLLCSPTTLPVSITSDPQFLFIFQSICIITGRLSLTPPPRVHTVAHNLEGNRKLPLLSSHISPAGPTTHRRQP